MTAPLPITVVGAMAPSGVRLVKSADQTNSTTTLANESDLTIAIGAGETWILNWTIAATCSNVGGVKITVVAPSGAAGLLTSTMVAATAVSGSFALGTSLGYAPGTSGTFYVNVVVTNGSTPGFVTLQFAQSSADATTTTVLKYSNLIAARVP